MKNQKIERILEISKKLGLSHIGSCISVLPILEEIYSKKKPEDKVLLDAAHAHLAHLVIRGEYDLGYGLTSDKLKTEYIKRFGIHCDRKSGCDATGGSLGHALGISIGFALVDETRTNYVIITDGSICEGSGLEALRIIKILGIKNIEIHANFNGYTAISKVDLDYWEQFIKGFGVFVKFHRTNNGLKELQGVKGHYIKLNEDTNTQSIKSISKG